MKIAIKEKQNLSLRLAVLLKRLVAEGKEELILFSTPDVAEQLKKLLTKSGSITEIYVSDKTIYLAKGLKIQIEIIDGFNKLKQIAEGYKNLVRSKANLTSDGEEKLFTARKEICDECQPDNKLTCNSCGCVLPAKIRCMGCECPKELW